METEHLEAEPELRTRAERVVSEAMNRAVNFSSMARLTEEGRRSAVYRCISDTGGKFIVKKSPGYAVANLGNLETADRDAKMFFNDWVGAEFLSATFGERRISPRFFGGDIQAGFFVMEDLGGHPGLVEPLLHGDAPAAEAALMRYSTCLGKLHAGTAGKLGAYEAIYAARFPGGAPPAYELNDLGARIGKIKAQLETLGVRFNAALEEEFAQVAAAIAHPGPFLAYIHADPCPDNVFDLSDGLRLIDFETGHFGHALLDGAYPRMIWPSCWCANRLPVEIVKRVEARYRAELVPGIPQAEEDSVWETAWMHLCALVLIFTLDYQFATEEDHEWGIGTIRQRVLARLEVFIQTAEEFRRLPALHGMAGEVLEILQKRWADVPRLPVYPAFQNKE